MSKSKPNTIEEVFYDLWEELGSGRKNEIAKQVNKPLSTLSREISIHDPGAKLGVDMLVPLVKAFNSLAPVDFILAELGLKAVSSEDVSPDGHTMFEEFHQTMQAIAELHLTGVAYREGRSTKEELARAEREAIREIREDVARTIRGDVYPIDGHIMRGGKLESAKVQQ